MLLEATMGRQDPIPTKFKKERIQVLRTVTLDKLLSDTLISQFSFTNVIWGLIELALDEHLFLREKEMVARSGTKEPLMFPMDSEIREHREAREEAKERLEREFRQRFCSDPPYGKIEWEKLGEFLRSKRLLESET
jgi:hypothetical protein